MIEITTHATTLYTYYQQAESHDLFVVKSSKAGRAHNAGYRHKVIKHIDGSYSLDAQSSIIPASPSTTEDVFRDEILRIGDTIKVDDQEFMIMSRPLADPVLMPVEDVQIDSKLTGGNIMASSTKTQDDTRTPLTDALNVAYDLDRIVNDLMDQGYTASHSAVKATWFMQ